MTKHDKLTLEEKNNIILQYQNNIPIRTIAKQFNHGRGTIYQVLEIAGFDTSRKRKIPIKEDFLDIIDTEEKAYFLGWMWSDGCVNPRDNLFSIVLKGSDKGILEKLDTFFHYSNQVKVYSRDKFKDGYYCALNVYSEKLKNRLIELGCHPNKTFTLKFPSNDSIPNELLKHFIRGIMDGDGHLGANRISVLGTKEVLLGIEKTIKNNLNIDGGKLYNISQTGNNTYNFYIGSYARMIPFLEWIYKDATIYLERKYKTYLWILNNYELFLNPPKKEYIIERQNKVLKLFNEGLGSRKIANVLGVDRSTIISDYIEIGINNIKRDTTRKTPIENKCINCGDIKSIDQFRERKEKATEKRKYYESICLICEKENNKIRLKNRYRASK